MMTSRPARWAVSAAAKPAAPDPATRTSHMCVEASNGSSCNGNRRDARAPPAGSRARYWPDLSVHDSLEFPNTPASEHPYAKDRDAPDRQSLDGDRKPE